MADPEQPTLRDGDVVLRPHTDERGDAAFVVVHAGEQAGSVAVRAFGGGRGELSWSLPEGDTATAALRLLTQHAFAELGLVRLEAYVAPDDVTSLRLAARTGMRREGVLRRRGTVGGERRDHVLLARLADDPPPQTRDGFIGLLNAALPTKRVIAQGLLRNSRGQVLLCELTYKREWDLPGGVVEPGESPAQGVVREVREELGLDVAVHRLVTVNWLPPWRGWDDACAFVFDLGVVADGTAMLLQPTEIVAAHWCEPADVAEHATAATAGLLDYLGRTPDTATYLEIGAEPPLP